LSPVPPAAVDCPADRGAIQLLADLRPGWAVADDARRARFVGRLWERDGSGDPPRAAVTCGQTPRSWPYLNVLTCDNAIEQRPCRTDRSVVVLAVVGSKPVAMEGPRQTVAHYPQRVSFLRLVRSGG
jgi:hypothetical protein